MAVGYTKVGGTDYPIDGGLRNSEIALTFNGVQGSGSTSGNSQSYSFTLPAGHDYLVSVTAHDLGTKFYGGNYAASTGTGDYGVTFELSNHDLTAIDGGFAASRTTSATPMLTGRAALPASYTITTVVSAVNAAEDITLTATISSNLVASGSTSLTSRAYFSGFAIALY